MRNLEKQGLLRGDWASWTSWRGRGRSKLGGKGGQLIIGLHLSGQLEKRSCERKAKGRWGAGAKEEVDELPDGELWRRAGEESGRARAAQEEGDGEQLRAESSREDLARSLVSRRDRSVRPQLLQGWS